MIILLSRRHHGEHVPVKRTSILGEFADYVTYGEPVAGQENPVVDEDTLLKFIPKDFLPCEPKHVLLVVDDVGGGGGTAVGTPTKFRKWGKYFDAFSLTLKRE